MTPRMRYMHDGGSMPCEPSRFVREIPQELLDKSEPAPYRQSFSTSPRLSYNRSFR